jgi:hypothetical protein
VKPFFSEDTLQNNGTAAGCLKKLRRAEGCAKIFVVFRVKNHDFTPKNHIFSNFRGGARRVPPPLYPPLYAVPLFCNVSSEKKGFTTKSD